MLFHNFILDDIIEKKVGEQMKIDLHTHTILSGHAYSTVKENIDQAAARGLQQLGLQTMGLRCLVFLKILFM